MYKLSCLTFPRFKAGVSKGFLQFWENPVKILHGCQVKEMGQPRNFQKKFAAPVFPVHGLIVSEGGREKTYQNA
jgi:hypothetical protein